MITDFRLPPSPHLQQYRRQRRHLFILSTIELIVAGLMIALTICVVKPKVMAAHCSVLLVACIIAISIGILICVRWPGIICIWFCLQLMAILLLFVVTCLGGYMMFQYEREWQRVNHEMATNYEEDRQERVKTLALYGSLTGLEFMLAIYMTVVAMKAKTTQKAGTVLWHDTTNRMLHGGAVGSLGTGNQAWATKY